MDGGITAQRSVLGASEHKGSSSVEHTISSRLLERASVIFWSQLVQAVYVVRGVAGIVLHEKLCWRIKPHIYNIFCGS